MDHTPTDVTEAPVLVVRGLRVDHDGTTAVAGIDLDLRAGEVLAVLGPSGCGKSTLLRAIAGLDPIHSGTVRYAGQDLAGVPVHRRGFALMFQDGQLFGHLDVARNVEYALRLRRVPAASRRARVADLLALVGLAGYQSRMPGTLSGGERQRVALARALAVEPRLLLLDEPLSALDATLREHLAGELGEILRAAGTSTLMVTHDHEEAFAVADRLAVLRAGRLVQEGPIDQVWAHPADPDTARFLGYAQVVGAPVVARLVGLLAGSGGAAPGGLPVGAAGEVDWALRRSALVLDDSGPLVGEVRSARSTPDLVRVTIDLDGIDGPEGPGTAWHAVAAPGSAVATGARARLRLDPTRVAPLGSPPVSPVP